MSFTVQPSGYTVSVKIGGKTYKGTDANLKEAFIRLRKLMKRKFYDTNSKEIEQAFLRMVEQIDEVLEVHYDDLQMGGQVNCKEYMDKGVKNVFGVDMEF